MFVCRGDGVVRPMHHAWAATREASGGRLDEVAVISSNSIQKHKTALVCQWGASMGHCRHAVFLKRSVGPLSKIRPPPGKPSSGVHFPDIPRPRRPRCHLPIAYAHRASGGRSTPVWNRHRHAIEQASCRWRGGRRDDSARRRRKILISTQVTRTTTTTARTAPARRWPTS